MPDSSLWGYREIMIGKKLFKTTLATFAATMLFVVVATASSLVYHGNVKSHIFHAPHCRYFNCKNCRVVFNSREEAIKAGFRPCKICNP